jgi:two-component system cell cycle sensor histidine kinase/response regulator CckA
MSFAETRNILLPVVLALALSSPSIGGQLAAQPVRSVRVVMDDDYAPYVFRSDDGELQGILIDQWRLWEQKTGIRAEIHAMAWDQALRRMRAGEFDVIDSVVETDERRTYFDFTPAYATVEASIFFQHDIAGITGMASLIGIPIAVKDGDQHIDELRANGITTVISFQSYNGIVLAAKQHKISVFIADRPTAVYLLHKAGIAAKFRSSAPIFRDQLRRAVQEGDAKTLRIVSEGFAAIDAGDLKRIDEKWFGLTLNRYGLLVAYAAYTAGAALLIIAALFGWNHALRKRIQQRTAALVESEQRFRQIAENIREVFWLITLDPIQTLYISPAYEAIWGRSIASVYEDPYSLIAAIHPEDRPRVIEITQKDREHAFDVEYRLVMPDGSIRWTRDRGFPIRDEAGRVYRRAGIAEDITERRMAAEVVKQAETRGHLIIDTMPTMVWRLRPDGTVDFVNQNWLDYVGVSFEDAIEDPNDIVHPEDLPRVVETWLVDMTAGRPSEDEMRLRRADGEYRWFLVRTVPLRDERGNIVNWYGTSTDIEDRKRAEEKLKATSEQLRALSARLHLAREEEGTRIAREIHDELGATLTTLRWELEGLKKTLVEPEKALPAAELKDKLAAMLGLTDTMINMVRKIASDLRPVVLDVDAEQSTAIFRIFQEALTNVLRHARATRVDVTMVGETGAFVLLIRDNGRGITQNERTGELSIGLLGMRERAHLIGGAIDVSGHEGEGTRVTLRLPTVDA